MAEKVLSRSMEAANQVPELNEEQQREQAFQEELWRVMNNRMLQSAMGSNSPPGMRGFFMK